MKPDLNWFEASKEGLRKQLSHRDKAFLALEPLQNSLDTNATTIDVWLEPVSGQPLVDITVVDNDPEGYHDLTHAYTIFAESIKKNDPTKRGWMNLGEKLVLALCKSAIITSTKGTVIFDERGRLRTKTRQLAGTTFQGRLMISRAEYDEVCAAMWRVLPPPGVQISFNDAELPSRPPIHEFEAFLLTQRSNDEGMMVRTERKTRVTVHEVREGERASIYEMGIPVVELNGGERWHVNVHQKVPLNKDRDNVPPAFLQTVRVLLANEMRDRLTKTDAVQTWVAAATSDERCEGETVGKMLDERFGKKRATFDPSDPEANKALMNEGYTVIPGGSLSKGQWDHVRAHGLSAAAGVIKPSGVQYGDGPPEKVVDSANYTPAMKQVVAYAEALAQKLLNKHVAVRVVSEPIRRAGKAAWYSPGTLTFNFGVLGKKWFEQGVCEATNDLLLHEFAHDSVDDHLTREFADATTRLGASLVALALREPEFFVCLGYGELS